MLGYPPMALFLNKTGRPIALSCEYAAYQRGSLLKVGNIVFVINVNLNLNVNFKC